MIVPQIGLSDGIIHILYERNRDKIRTRRTVDEAQIPIDF